jgi:hypothetical protein
MDETEQTSASTSQQNETCLSKSKVRREEESLENSNVTNNEVAASKKTKKLKNEIRKPLSVWFLFCAEEREVMTKDKNFLPPNEAMKLLAEKYRNISPDEKLRLEEAVRIDKERYQKEMDAAKEEKDSLVNNEESSDKLDAYNADSKTTLAFPMVITYLHLIFIILQSVQ